MASRRHRFELCYRPGATLTREQREQLSAELRALAWRSSSVLLEGEALDDAVVAIARGTDQVPLGFRVGRLLPVRPIGPVLHLGLCAVRPGAWAMELARELTARLIRGAYVRTRLLGRLWVSSLSRDLDCLREVTRLLEGVFPAPGGPERAPRTHRLIARALDRRYRRELGVTAPAAFDDAWFVFRHGARGAARQPSCGPPPARHDEAVDRFYVEHLRLDARDEVLQVGWASGLSLLRCRWRRMARALPRARSEAASG